MKAIIAEKPSVGMDIARVVGATDKKDGYCTGNGYMVTWALGHLVSLAMPGAYGYTKTSRCCRTRSVWCPARSGRTKGW